MMQQHEESITAIKNTLDKLLRQFNDEQRLAGTYDPTVIVPAASPIDLESYPDLHDGILK